MDFPRFFTSLFDSVGRPGNPYYALDIPHGAAGYLEQVFTVPAGHTKLEYLVWGGLDPVTARIQILSEDGANIIDQHVFTPVITQTTTGTVLGATAQLRSFSVTPGQRIRLRLGASSDPSTFNSVILPVDDIRTSP